MDKLEAATESQSIDDQELITDDPKYQSMLEEQTLIEQFRMENKIKEPVKLWKYVNNNLFVMNILSILGIFWGASLFSKEFKSNTIKSLLATPFSRREIYLSKFLALGLVVCIGTLLTYLVSFLIGAVYYQPSFTEAGSFLIMRDDEVVEYSAYTYTLFRYLLKGLEIMVVSYIALTISVLVRGFILSIIVSYLLFFIGDAVVLYFTGRAEWIDYSLFANINYSSYMSGSSFMNGSSLSTSLTITVLYIAGLYAISLKHLNTKDIGAI
ncbi:ABC transporter permease subunit [Rossellomorea vietnamensis]|uniref:ABC transporter permease subunit n=1 Tax=Rossellomorea vietnamensis TaxID=218284 RepID=A0A6I6UJZ3_9BACI|nr:ABC transporter permease subunit [Rossellomorea vietnamensis]QHE63304.1 ABC transporter permease subunit [Rossellomorea vietnamensis]